MKNPVVPALMPPAVGEAIGALLAFRSVEPVEIYRAIREALQALPEQQRRQPAPERQPGEDEEPDP